jgi:hypothetical protein
MFTEQQNHPKQLHDDEQSKPRMKKMTTHPI